MIARVRVALGSLRDYLRGIIVLSYFEGGLFDWAIWFQPSRLLRRDWRIARIG